MKAALRFEHQLLAVESDHEVNCIIELTAPSSPNKDERPPLSLALVLDRSGSMAGRKLEVTRACAADLVRRLGPADKAAVIAYDDMVDVVAPLAPVDGDLLATMIGQIPPGGMTNLSGGWLKGFEEVRRDTDERTGKVILLTDGLANVGITAPDELKSLTGNARTEGVSTSTIGFGEDFDEDLLTEMAAAGGGDGHFAETPDDAPKIFDQEFEGLISLVAQNVSVEIRPGPEVEMLGVLNDFPNVGVEGGVQVQIGDCYGDEVRRVVFALHLPSVAALGPATVAEVVLRYVSIGDNIEAHEITMPVKVNYVSSDEAKADEGDQGVKEQVLILRGAKTQEEARRLADMGDFDGARDLLSDQAGQLRTFAADMESPAAFEKTADILEAEASSLDTWGPSRSKRMHYRSRRYHSSSSRNRPEDEN